MYTIQNILHIYDYNQVMFITVFLISQNKQKIQKNMWKNAEIWHEAKIKTT